MNGFLLIDKPLGITSFDVLRKLKKRLNIKKMGHTGTLDPLASGCLLVALGTYTKLIPYFEKDFKEYEFTINLDGWSESYDEGTDINYLSEDEKLHFKNTLTKYYLEKIIIDTFSGTITQLPPKYSALKIGGKKAVDMVRNGEEFELQKREVQVRNIDFLGFDYPKVTLRMEVSAGTYIRSIASDLGKILGTGGYISYLRRTKIGNIDISKSIKIEDVESTSLFENSLLFNSDNFIKLDDYIINKINNGIKQTVSINLDERVDYFVIDDDNNITNIIRYINGRIVPIKKI